VPYSRPDRDAFAEQFRAAGAASEVAVFANLGGDARLIAPCPRGEPRAYPHLAAFARHAPAAQQHALWARVGSELAAMIGTRPLWLSTSGLGVPWLHVRIDRSPKYYTHAPYRDAA